MSRHLNRREKLLAVITLGTIVVYATVQGIFSPLVGELNEKELAISQKHVQILAMFSLLGRNESMQLPDDGTPATESPSALTAQFLRDIDAARGKVEIQRFQPLRTSAADRASGQGHLALEVKISCVGQLPHLMAFVNKLESRDRLSRVRHLYLAAAGDAAGRLKCQFSIVRICAL